MIVRRIIRADRTTMVFDRALDIDQIRALIRWPIVVRNVPLSDAATMVLSEQQTFGEVNQDATILLQLAGIFAPNPVRGDVAIVPAEDLKIPEPA